MKPKKMKLGKLEVGDYVYLDEDDLITKKTLFGLRSRTAYKKSLYRIIGKEQVDGGLLRVTAKNVRSREVRVIVSTPHGFKLGIKSRFKDEVELNE